VHKKILFNILIIFLLFKTIQFFFFNITAPLGQPFGIWQILNKKLLNDYLISSIYYLHNQPFLWNLLVGLITKLFNGNETYIRNFINFYNLFLTFGIIIYSIKIASEYNLSNFKIYIIVFFLLFNPAIIFWENLLYYYHTICFLIFQINYCAIKFFKRYYLKYEIYIYLNLVTLIFIWSLFNPIILLIFFLLTIYRYKYKRTSIILCCLFLFISFVPNIKNYFVFGTMQSSWLGQQIAITTNTVRAVEYCGIGPINYSEENLQNYYKLFNKKKQFNHPSLVGNLSERNYVGNFYLSKLCLDRSIDLIKKNFKVYFKGIIFEFLSLHGKMLIDHSIYHGSPQGWEFISDKIRFIDKNLRLYKQILNISLMLFIYYYFINKIFFTKINKGRKFFLLFFFFLYFYIIFMGSVFSKYEGERFIYVGYTIFVLFLINLFSTIKSITISKLLISFKNFFTFKYKHFK